MRRVKDTTLSDWLEVKPEESGALEKLPPAARFGRQEAPPALKGPDLATRRAIVESRHRVIREIVAGLGRIPPCREMAAILQGRGFGVGHVKVSQDYKVLDLKTPRVSRRDTAARQITLSINELQEEMAS
jgi:hypothetical protein